MGGSCSNCFPVEETRSSEILKNLYQKPLKLKFNDFFFGKYGFFSAEVLRDAFVNGAPGAPKMCQNVTIKNLAASEVFFSAKYLTQTP